MRRSKFLRISGSALISGCLMPHAWAISDEKEKQLKELQNMSMLSSPHCWGNRLKTHYTAHLSAGLGNVCTIEGVTCESDDIDYGDYPIVNGKIRVSDEPGFGMKLLKT